MIIMNRWEKNELKRKYGITFVSLFIIAFGGLFLGLPPINNIQIPLLQFFGGAISGMAFIAFAIIFNLHENPRLFDCVKGAIIYDTEYQDQIRKRTAKWRRQNL